MLRKSCQIVVAALLLMAVLTPVMQLDSWDKFPVSSDDIELAVTFCLCTLGMGLVFTTILKLVPTLLLSQLHAPSHRTRVFARTTTSRTTSTNLLPDTPLRI